MRRFGFGAIAFILGVAGLFAIQISATEVWAFLGTTWGPSNLPLHSSQQFASLTTLFIAVFGGSLIGAIVGKQDRWWVLAAMCLVGVSVDGYVMFLKIGDLLPLWFRVTFVTTIVVATAAAGWIFDRLQSRREAERSGPHAGRV